MKANEIPLLASNSLQNFKQIEQKIPEILDFHFFNVLDVAPVTSYLSENEAKNLQNGNVHLAQIPDFGIEYLENHWLIEVSDGSFFGTFHVLSFEPNFVFDRSFPLINT